MKRLNPETGKPFKYGDIREDGKIFFSYDTKDLVKKTGYFYERWKLLSAFERKKEYAKEWRLKNADSYNAKSRQFNKGYTSSINGRARRLIASAKSRSIYSGKNRGIVTIDAKWVIDKLNVGYCEITGLPFDFMPSNKFRNNPYSPSLDRINSDNYDYTPENVRVVLTAVNTALNEFGLKIMKPIMKKMINY